MYKLEWIFLNIIQHSKFVVNSHHQLACCVYNSPKRRIKVNNKVTILAVKVWSIIEGGTWYTPH